MLKVSVKTTNSETGKKSENNLKFDAPTTFEEYKNEKYNTKVYCTIM